MTETELYAKRDWRVVMELPELTMISKPFRGDFGDAACAALELTDTMARSGCIVINDKDAQLVISTVNQLLPHSLKALDALATASEGNCVIMLQRKVFDAWVNWDEGDPE